MGAVMAVAAVMDSGAVGANNLKLSVMSSHGSATADASVMAPSPFAVKLSVGAVGAVEVVVVLLVAVWDSRQQKRLWVPSGHIDPWIRSLSTTCWALHSLQDHGDLLSSPGKAK